jgi:hypothetical protein
MSGGQLSLRDIDDMLDWDMLDWDMLGWESVYDKSWSCLVLLVVEKEEEGRGDDGLCEDSEGKSIGSCGSES